MMIARFGHRILEESEYTCEYIHVHTCEHDTHDDGAETHLLHACRYADVVELLSSCFSSAFDNKQSNASSIEKQIAESLGANITRTFLIHSTLKINLITNN